MPRAVPTHPICSSPELSAAISMFDSRQVCGGARMTSAGSWRRVEGGGWLGWEGGHHTSSMLHSSVIAAEDLC